MQGDMPDFEKMSKNEMKDLLMDIYANTPTTVIECAKPQRSELHPTMKPIPLIGTIMVNSSRSGNVVLDIFGGSGTTLMASEQLGRRCFMVEKEPKFVDVIIQRWEELTGKTAILVGNINEIKE